MKIFFHIEASEYTKPPIDCNLISLSMMTESGDKFYAEFSDNVETKTSDYQKKKDNFISYIQGYHIGSLNDIRTTLLNWFKQFNTIELVSDCGYYNMVYFCNIFGGAGKLPKNITPMYYDINNAISEKFNLSITDAYQKSRYDILWNEHRDRPRDDKIKDPLYYVWEMRELYQILKNVDFNKKG